MAWVLRRSPLYHSPTCCVRIRHQAAPSPIPSQQSVHYVLPFPCSLHDSSPSSSRYHLHNISSLPVTLYNIICVTIPLLHRGLFPIIFARLIFVCIMIFVTKSYASQFDSTLIKSITDGVSFHHVSPNLIHHHFNKCYFLQ